MKRRFTILTAALALLAFLAIPMGMWGQSTYTKVTTAPSDWSGTYVIVADESSVIFTGQSGANNYGGSAAVTISDNSVTGNFAAYEVEIEQSGTYYSIKHINSSKYLGWTSGNYLYFSTTAPTANSYRWVLSTSSILNADDNSRKLQYNSSSPRFACYTSNQKVAYLYKKETGGGTTPTMSVSTNSIDFGSNAINPENPYTQTFDVTFANLTQNLTVTGFSGVTVSPTTISANATSPQTVTISYNPTTVGSISGNISVNSSEVDEVLVAVTGSAYDPSNVDTYERYTGALVEGDYIICANAEVAMKNVISGSRFENEAVTVSDNKIVNPGASIIWHIAPDGEYFTMYNAAVDKYAAGTTSNNQGTLIDDVTDYAKWDITYSYSNYTVICIGRNSSNNKYLRRNGDYGWATYANSTGQVPTFYKKVVANQVATPTFSPVEGTYYETQSVTLSCATDGATIYYTTDGTTPSASNGTVYTTAISVSTTTTIKAIAIATGMTDSDVATATYTIEQPYSTIPALFAAATNIEQDVRVTFNNWVVSGVSTNGRSVYVTDNTGNGFIIYFTSDMSGTFAAGNILSGTSVACKLKLYNGAAELVNLTAADLTITTGGTVSISDIPMSDLSGVNTGALISYNNLTCSVSDNKYYLTDGTTTLQAYNTLYAFDEFEAGKTYNVTGVYVQYNSIKEIAPRSTDDIEEVQVQHDEYTLTVSNLSHVNLFIFGGEESETIISTEDGETTAQVYDGTEVLVSIDVEAGYVFQSLTITDGNGAPVETEELTANEYYSFLMPTSNVTITATAVEYVAPVGGDYVRITSLDQLTDGSKVIIAARHNATADSYYAMQNATSGKPEGTLFTSVTSGNDEAVTSTITDDEDNYYWMVNVTENGYTFTNASNHMIGYSSSTNFATGGDNIEWTIESAEAGNNAMVPGYEGFVIKNHSHSDRAFAFNGSVFGAYSTNNMNAAGYNFFLDFFVQTLAPVTETYTKHINAFDTDNEKGWYLIASPLAAETVPTDVANLISANASNYALYRFNENPTVVNGVGNEWENYKAHTNDFLLEPGRGYLYGNSTEGGVDLIFTGAAYDGDSKDVTLSKTAGAEFEGLNLVGNPFAVEAYIDRPYYTMNGTGTGIMTQSSTGAIGAMVGIFVEAERDGETLTFTTQAPAPAGNKGLVLNLSQGRGVVDRAIVRFGEGRTLHKFMLNENSTKVYIPQDGEDFAVVRSHNSGEVSVNFEPAEDGVYSLSINAENLAVRSLILTDKVERVNIDLLRTPSYQFKASKDDPADRFVLSFKTGSNLFEEEAGERSDFGFFNNGSWMIDNEGEATLQVIDVNGRILSNETINGNASIKVDAAPGVYMLRLINGDNVKVQKVVVR